MPIDAGLGEVNWGEKTTIIPPLYDGLSGRWQARTTTVNVVVPIPAGIAWFPAPLSGKLCLQAPESSGPVDSASNPSPGLDRTVRPNHNGFPTGHNDFRNQLPWRPSNLLLVNSSRILT
jgi:hypothetical protein